MTATKRLIRLHEQSVAVATWGGSLGFGRGQVRRQACASATPRLTWSRGVAPRLLVVASVVLTCMLVALQQSPRASSVQLADEVTPVPELAPGCRLQGEQARAHAARLEQSAHARWQRVPFALREAPRALVDVGEAMACYGAVGDRPGTLRSTALLHAYEAELVRRFARARLLLRALTRPSVEGARAQQQEGHARHEVLTLLALLDRASPSAEPLRRELLQLDRSYAGRAAARALSNEVKR